MLLKILQQIQPITQCDNLAAGWDAMWYCIDGISFNVVANITVVYLCWQSHVLYYPVMNYWQLYGLPT